MVAGLPKVVAADFCDPLSFCNSFSPQRLIGRHAFRNYHLAHSEHRLCFHDSSCVTHALSEARRHNQVRLTITAHRASPEAGCHSHHSPPYCTSLCRRGLRAHSNRGPRFLPKHG